VADVDVFIVTVHNEGDGYGRVVRNVNDGGFGIDGRHTGGGIAVTNGLEQGSIVGIGVEPFAGIGQQIGEQGIGGGHGDDKIVNLMPAQQINKTIYRTLIRSSDERL
jgi:hypothetical protein